VKRRLLLDSEVVAFLEGLPLPRRTAIWRRLREISDAPDRFEDFHEKDASGRDLAGHIFGSYAILYWDDLADRHLKVLEITSADDFLD
jgi:hypothetical protein